MNDEMLCPAAAAPVVANAVAMVACFARLIVVR
jgi:hypothetical protein